MEASVWKNMHLLCTENVLKIHWLLPEFSLNFITEKTARTLEKETNLSLSVYIQPKTSVYYISRHIRSATAKPKVQSCCFAL